MRVEIDSLKALEAWVNNFAKELTAPHLLLLSGPMGTGKTQFTHFLAKALGAPEEACSPSFAIHNSYNSNPPMEHLDLYRLQDEDDLESVGFWDLFEQSSIIVVEWADRLDESFLPSNWPATKLGIEKLEGQKRAITISNIR